MSYIQQILGWEKMENTILTLDWIYMKLGNSAMALEQKEGWIMLLKNG